MQTNSTFSIIFFTRKLRSNTNQLLIYARITVNGKRSEMSLKRCAEFNEWDNNKNKGRENTEKIKALNAYLDQVYGKTTPMPQTAHRRR